MRRRFIAFFVPFLLLYGLANYYVASRFLPLAAALLGRAAWISWAVFVFGAGASLMARMHMRRTRHSLGNWAATLGDYWLVIVFHGLLLWGTVDIVRLLLGARTVSASLGAGVALALCASLAYGYKRARVVRVARYNVALNKRVPGLSALRAILVSDLHLGTATNNARLSELVERIIAMAPDIVFFAGDTIDGDISEFAADALPRLMRKLTPRFGLYAVLGNHEHLGAKQGDAVRQLESLGITVLVDSYRRVDGKFYIVGRDDAYTRRRALSAVMEGVDRMQPIILLDHQPTALEEAQRNGVDLMLSGHTHHGQFFPNNLLTQRIFAVDWGYLRQGALQVIVSCGFGTWGPPIRTSGWSEIVEVEIGTEERDIPNAS